MHTTEEQARKKAISILETIEEATDHAFKPDGATWLRLEDVITSIIFGE